MAVCGCHCLKWIVFFFNFVFWLAGVSVLALSIWMLSDQTVTFMSRGAENYATGTYILLAAGSLMTIIGFLGCCGALRESQCLLGTFFTLLLVILVAEIGAGVWTYANQDDLKKKVEDSFRDTIQRDYGRDDVTTATLDLLQQKLKCCGADSYASWANAAFNTGKGSNNDGRTSPFGDAISSLAGISPVYTVPKSCCVKPDSNVCETTRKLGSVGFIASAVGGNIYTEGCAPKVEAVLQQYATYVYGAGIAIVIIEVLGMIFSLVLCCAIRRIDDFKA